MVTVRIAARSAPLLVSILPVFMIEILSLVASVRAGISKEGKAKPPIAMLPRVFGQAPPRLV